MFQASPGKETGLQGSQVGLEDTEGWGHGSRYLFILCSALSVLVALNHLSFLLSLLAQGAVMPLSPHHWILREGWSWVSLRPLGQGLGAGGSGTLGHPGGGSCGPVGPE